MKDKLTNKEIELMNQVREEWINRFNSLEFDEEKAKRLMKFRVNNDFKNYDQAINHLLDNQKKKTKKSR